MGEKKSLEQSGVNPGHLRAGVALRCQAELHFLSLFFFLKKKEHRADDERRPALGGMRPTFGEI